MELAVHAFGPDRPGIVAAVTGVLAERGGNLEDSAMTMLQGQFAMMIVVDVPDDVGPTSLEEELAAATGELGLTVVVRVIGPSDGHGAVDRASAWDISVSGADRPGIVHRIATVLADAGANIVDLNTRLLSPGYVLLLEVTLPLEGDPAALEGALRAAAGELGVELAMRPDDADLF